MEPYPWASHCELLIFLSLSNDTKISKLNKINYTQWLKIFALKCAAVPHRQKRGRWGSPFNFKRVHRQEQHSFIPATCLQCACIWKHTRKANFSDHQSSDTGSMCTTQLSRSAEWDRKPRQSSFMHAAAMCPLYCWNLSPAAPPTHN